MVRKNMLLIIACFAILLGSFSIICFSFGNTEYLEQKIAHHLYIDQPIQALRDIRILLLFHPNNIYGARIQKLLTSTSIQYP
jgi:hypothetical protein